SPSCCTRKACGSLAAPWPSIASSSASCRRASVAGWPDVFEGAPPSSPSGDAMRIHWTMRHCELDPEDRLLAEQRLEKLSRFARDIQEAHVIVSQEKYRYLAEIAL